ncbi:MAG: hypothetical protein FJ304_22550 [Planctomycetes bacterium]|nr:hypothetical protein [Planctomycetota bacterium]
MPAPAPRNPSATPAAPATVAAPDGDEPLAPQLPEEEFWERYNKRLEFPLATVATVFLHVIVGAMLVYIIVGLMDPGEDRSNPELKLMQVGGLDDAGEGASGSGGVNDPDIVRDVNPYDNVKDVLPTEQALKDAQADIKKLVLEDPNGKLPIAAPNAAAYARLEKSLRDKLMGVGAQKGDGNQPGKGFDDSKGSGPGGTGADSTRARGLRWVLRFRVAGGGDYISQLKAMGAEILVPLPPDNKRCLIIRDLDNPRATDATDADLGRLARKIQFSDARPDQVRDVLSALNVNAPGAKAFWAFFPKELEEELARKETGYRNRRAEDIEETIFRVTIRGGRHDIVVDDQTFKK